MYFVYLLECADRSLYTGITTDVERRLLQHKRGTASRYTRAHKAKRMLYREECTDRSEASKREAQIKRLPRTEKLALVRMYQKG